LNHHEKIKAERSRLIPRKLTENLELLLHSKYKFSFSSKVVPLQFALFAGFVLLTMGERIDNRTPTELCKC